MTPEPETIRVVIIEDDAEIREALALLVQGTPGLRCAGAFARFEDASPAIIADPPEVVLLDIGLPGVSGLEAAARIRAGAPAVEIVMLTIREDDEAIFQALQAGACGYLLKTSPPARILEAIREARCGGAPMSPSVARRVAESFRRPMVSPLSPREGEVLSLLCDGHTYKTIAARLYVSVETVHTHLKAIYRKLEVNSKSEAVAKALRDRLV
jgi:DNA-binding NarL/FixJ family response regulator